MEEGAGGRGLGREEKEVAGGGRVRIHVYVRISRVLSISMSVCLERGPGYIRG